VINFENIFKILNEKPHPRILFEIFNENGFEIRFVGGCIRDAILGKNDINDIDFATNAKPEKMQEILQNAKIKYFDSGLKHGTITAVFEKTCYEITSLRLDKSCDGRHAEVSFDASWEDDASRRDFTFNAFYMDFKGNFYDFFYGLDDLLNLKLRFIKNPFERINEDYLRILRALRFFNRYCLYGLEKDSLNAKAICDLSGKLNCISGERIRDEVLKIFDDSNEIRNFKNLEYFYSLNLTEYIFLQKKELNFEILYFWKEISFENLVNLSGIQKFALVLKHNNIDPCNIKKRWALSNKDSNYIKKIYDFDLLNIDDFFLNPKKYIYLYSDFLKEIIILIFFNKKEKIYNLEKIKQSFFLKEDCLENREILKNLLLNLHLIEKPIIPINSKILIDFGFKGKEIGFAFSEFEKIWLNQNCREFSRDEIIYEFNNFKTDLY
jgi:poly(A) polymerase